MIYTHPELGEIRDRDGFRLDGQGYSPGYLIRHPDRAEKLGFEAVPPPEPEPPREPTEEELRESAQAEARDAIVMRAPEILGALLAKGVIDEADLPQPVREARETLRTDDEEKSR